MLDVADGLAEQRDHVLVVQRIDASATVSLRANERMVAQNAELVRHRGLLELELLDELRDVVRPLEEAAQDLHTGWSRERKHGIGHELRDALVERLTRRLTSGQIHDAPAPPGGRPLSSMCPSL